MCYIVADSLIRSIDRSIITSNQMQQQQRLLYKIRVRDDPAHYSMALIARIVIE